MENREKFIAEILNRLQFASMVAIFFSAVLYNFYNIFAKSNSDKTVLQYSAAILLYLLTYIFFDLFKNKLDAAFLKLINILIFIGLFTFIPPILFLTAAKNPTISGIKITLVQISVGALMLVPALLFIVTIVGIFYYLYKKKIIF